MKVERENLLLEALRSLETQMSEEMEIIVIKNYSSKIIEDYCFKYSITCIKSEKMLLGEKIAQGIQLSQGEVIAFLEDDDLFSECKISSILQYFDNNPDLDYYHNSYTCIDENGQQINYLMVKQPLVDLWIDPTMKSVHKLVKLMRYTPYGGMSSTALRRRSILKSSYLLNEYNMMTDQVIFFLIMIGGGKAFFDKRLLTKYRIHRSGTHDFLNFKKYDYVKNRSIEEYFISWEKLYKLCKGTPFENLAHSEYLFNKTRYEIYVKRRRQRSMVSAVLYLKSSLKLKNFKNGTFGFFYLSAEAIMGKKLTKIGYRLFKST